MTTHNHSHKHVLGIPPAKNEAEIRKAMARIFSEQKSAVIGRIPSIKDPKEDKLFDVDAWSRRIVKYTKAPITQIVIAGGTKALKSIRRFPSKPKDKKYYLPEAIALSKAVDWSVSTKAAAVIPEWLDDPDVLEAIDGQTYDFALAINDHTEESLRDALYEGMEAGETMDQLAERIEGLYEGWEGARAETIARTESARAYTTGHIEAWRSTGVVENKVWVSASDACHFCLDMNGTVVSLDENFMDEGETQEIEVGDIEMSMSQDYGDVIGPPLHPRCILNPNAPIFTDKGWVGIQYVKVGDMVLTHEHRFRPVTQIHRNATDADEDAIRLFIDGLAGEWMEVDLTPEHPVRVGSKWIAASRIIPSTAIRSMAMGLSCMVNEVKRYGIPKGTPLYNLSVAEDESFVVSGIIVHNCRCAVVGELSEEKMLSLKGESGCR